MLPGARARAEARAAAMVVMAYMSLVATSSAHLSSALLMQPEDTREDDSMCESESVEECCDDRGKLKCGLVNDKGDQRLG